MIQCMLHGGIYIYVGTHETISSFLFQVYCNEYQWGRVKIFELRKFASDYSKKYKERLSVYASFGKNMFICKIRRDANNIEISIAESFMWCSQE